METCLFNTCSNNVAAYCRYHHCGMTVKQMRCKNCLGKNCRHLEKNEAHQYWQQRKIVKQKRSDRKQAIREYVSQF